MRGRFPDTRWRFRAGNTILLRTIMGDGVAFSKGRGRILAPPSQLSRTPYNSLERPALFLPATGSNLSSDPLDLSSDRLASFGLPVTSNDASPRNPPTSTPPSWNKPLPRIQARPSSSGAVALPLVAALARHAIAAGLPSPEASRSSARATCTLRLPVIAVSTVVRDSQETRIMATRRSKPHPEASPPGATPVRRAFRRRDRRGSSARFDFLSRSEISTRSEI